jgi:hypothetical protein
MLSGLISALMTQMRGKLAIKYFMLMTFMVMTICKTDAMQTPSSAIAYRGLTSVIIHRCIIAAADSDCQTHPRYIIHIT